MKIDVLVHPYYSELVRLPGTRSISDTEEKTRRWYQAIGELGKGDYLIIVSCATTQLQQLLTTKLLEHSRKVGCTVLDYHDSVPESVRELKVADIERIRGYGEIYRGCVDYETDYVKGQLGFRGEVELPKNLSVSLL